VTVEVEKPLELPLTHLSLLGRSAVTNQEQSWISWHAILHSNETFLRTLLDRESVL